MGEMKYIPAHTIEHSVLEAWVNELYGSNIDVWSTIPEELIGHYTYHEFTVDGQSELDSFGDEEVVQHWISTGQHTNIDSAEITVTYPDDYDWQYHWEPDYYHVEMKHMLHRLFKDGHIPAGKWYVLVDW